ncbi:MAG TPA: hypothetical protein VIK48_03590 [Candidatus Manganitrophaceae bacterium]|nr:hypothetical protein [Candidatus Manganitrophaceae bacterium]
MEQRKRERRQLIRGYGPERRVNDLPIAGLDLRHEQRRLKDRRQRDRRKGHFSSFFVFEEKQAG